MDVTTITNILQALDLSVKGLIQEKLQRLKITIGGVAVIVAVVHGAYWLRLVSFGIEGQDQHCETCSVQRGVYGRKHLQVFAMKTTSFGGQSSSVHSKGCHLIIIKAKGSVRMVFNIWPLN